MSHEQTVKREVDELTTSVSLQNGMRTRDISVDLRKGNSKQAGPSGSHDFTDCGSSTILVSTYIKGQEPLRKKITVFIEPIDGKKISMKVSPSDSVKDLMKKISEKKEITLDAIQLIFNGKQLVKEYLLSQYTICNESTLYMTNRLRGG